VPASKRSRRVALEAVYGVEAGYGRGGLRSKRVTVEAVTVEAGYARSVLRSRRCLVRK
jgi:hypothetical protein